VIGVNNRNLHTFQLDLETTAKAIDVAASRGISWRPSVGGVPDVQIAALSGITSSDDVAVFRGLGVACCLVGETLMKAADPAAMVQELLGKGPSKARRLLTKVCGLTNKADAEVVLQNGASFIGTVRYVQL
jgi:anthranilate synthase/indole-3-glycerol phosphate synthase/phosphoribosylanthranilate isomerase